jgi:hypothetical protein
MRVVRIAVLIVLMTVPAFAQNLTPGFRLNEGKEMTDEEKARNKANEEAAKAARATIPDGKVSNDPWATVRTTEPAKHTKSKTK